MVFIALSRVISSSLPHSITETVLSCLNPKPKTLNPKPS